MLLALLGVGVFGLSPDDSPPGLSQLVVRIEATREEMRTYAPLYVRVSVTNNGEEPFQFPWIPPTGKTGGMQFQYREAEGAWTNIRTNRQGRFGGKLVRAVSIPAKGAYVAREVLFCDEGNVVFTTQGTFELRAAMVLVYSGTYRYVTSEPVTLKIAASSAHHRQAIQDHKSVIQHVVEAECNIWDALSRDSFQLEAVRAARRDVDDEGVVQALRRAELYSVLVPAKEGMAIDRKEADKAVEELVILAKESHPVLREMIRVNLAAFFYRVDDVARGDEFRLGLNELGPDDRVLRSLRRVEKK